LRGKVHQEAQLFIVKEEREQVASSNHKSRAPLEALRWRPVQQINVKDLRGRDAFAGEGDRLRVAIEADQAAITDVERIKDPTSATSELNDGAASCLGERAPERTIILCACVEVTLVVEEPTPRR
jgi:hypothetical protein